MALVSQHPAFKKWILRLWNFWPPFLGAGIHVRSITDDLRHFEATLKMHFWNRNFFGTQYGGSLFSMTDAIYSVMLVENLGNDYIVWDKSATIRYLKPGRTDVMATFKIDAEILAKIKQELSNKEKMDWVKLVEIKDLNGEVIAEVEKVIYIRRKKKTNY